MSAGLQSQCLFTERSPPFLAYLSGLDGPLKLADGGVMPENLADGLRAGGLGNFIAKFNCSYCEYGFD